MVKLRLSRIGKRKQPYYRIVAMNVSAPRNGRALAEVGTYDPLHASIKIDAERAIEWLNNGAQMTETVAALFDSQGVLAQWQGREAQVREDALSQDKPKRRRKLAAQAATPAAEEAPEAPEAEAAAEAPEAPAEGAGEE
ncbi:MAG: 30S ribosomal protein S16 [Candidatus Latescibacteria bacterium]|nr:30S ribosomal protein S16 [Candidatus Latescibacterota bacterium]